MALADKTYGFFIPNVSLMGVGCSKETGEQAKDHGTECPERCHHADQSAHSK